MIADSGKAQSHLHRNYEKFFKAQEAYQRELQTIIAKASELSETIVRLAGAIEAAQSSDEGGMMLLQACPFILDYLDTIAARLEALDDEAANAATRSGL